MSLPAAAPRAAQPGEQPPGQRPRGQRPPAGGPRADRGQVLLLRLVAALFACYLLWKVRLGVDYSDGAYMVALAVRVARGDVPLVDEMSPHVLGVLPAVPFTWLWLQLFGTEGVVLASRVFYLVLAGAAGYVAYRALRVRYAPWPVGIAVMASLLPTPYGLLFTTYNTVPALSLLVGVTAGFAALLTSGRSRLRWALAAGAAAAVAAVGHPAVVGASVVLCLLLVAAGVVKGRREVVAGVVLGGGIVTAVVVSWALLVPGLEGLRTALDYTAAEQSQYNDLRTRLLITVHGYRDALLSVRYLPLLLAVLAAVVSGLAVPRESWRGGIPTRRGWWTDRLYAASLLAVVVGAVVPAVRVLLGPEPVQAAATPASLAVVLCGALLLPVALGAGRLEGGLRLLLLLGVPVALAGLVGISLSTKASPMWGPQLPSLLQLYAVLLLAVVLALGRAVPRWAGVAVSVALLGALMFTHSLHSFRDNTPGTMTGRIADGPYAGLHTNPAFVRLDGMQQEVLDRYTEPGGSVLVHGRPSAYLYTEARSLANALWQSRYGAGTTAMVERLERLGELPDVVLLDRGNLEAAGGWGSDQLADDDVVQLLRRKYADPVVEPVFVVFERLDP